MLDPDQPRFTDHPFTSERWDPVPFYRWWRTNVVATINHADVLTRVVEESRWSARYVFMTMMSAGIAVLGLLLSSPAVVIGAMLISPLMGPILGLGFALATFDFGELRRAGSSLALGSIGAILFTALIVSVSPLKAPTAEILARTRPNLFDLLVALFSALAGAYAIIRGRGETIVGVAIATALMPPLAVVGYGLATWNVPILLGSAALFITNFVTIGLAATALARIYGFGHYLSGRQNWLQTLLLIIVFVGMSVPLGISLERIGREALATSEIRALLGERFGPRSRITQLDLDFSREPVSLQAVVIAPRSRKVRAADIKAAAEHELGRPVVLQLDQILIDPSAGVDAAQLAADRAADAARKGAVVSARVSQILAAVAGVVPDAVTVDSGHQRVMASATGLAGASLETYRALEQRVTTAVDGWDVILVPPSQALPDIDFPSGEAELTPEAADKLALVIWAAKRWNIASISVSGLSEPVSETPTIGARRSAAVASVLRKAGIEVQAAQDAGDHVRLAPAVSSEAQ
jgi:uncharacterized hydrophobic protein (TIGR00271 family)